MLSTDLPGIYPAQQSKVFNLSDIIVLLCGVVGAFFLLAYPSVIDERQTPWDRRWVFAFPLLWSWLLPLAVGLLADMRSPRRWALAFVVYTIVLPGLSASSVYPLGRVMLVDQHLSLMRLNVVGTTLIPALLGLLLLPLIRAIDSTQPWGNYAGVFRCAWRMIVHGLLAGALAMSMITLLFLGAKLFETIGLTAFVQLFEKAAFWRIIAPITIAISLIGVQRRPQLIYVLQRSWLTLNSWMLPLASLLGMTFVVALGAQFALGQRAGTLSASVLLGFLAVWIKLINATWQDGLDTTPFGPWLRRLLRWSLYCLLPLAALALYHVLVRVDQYGWTEARVWSAFIAALAMIYSIGYGIAAIWPTRFYTTLACTNYTAVFFAIAGLIAFSIPSLDPQRVTVESQTRRLIDGRLELAQYNFQRMASSSGVYGQAALQRLAGGAADERDPRIAPYARQALAGSNRAGAVSAVGSNTMPRFTVYPADHVVPLKWWADVNQRFPNELLGCTVATEQPAEANAAPSCALIFAELSGRGQDNLILYVPGKNTFKVFSQNASGDWRWEGLTLRVDEPDNAASTLLADIARGSVHTVPRRGHDLMIGNTRLRR